MHLCDGSSSRRRGAADGAGGVRAGLPLRIKKDYILHCRRAGVAPLTTLGAYELGFLAGRLGLVRLERACRGECAGRSLLFTRVPRRAALSRF